MTPANRGGGGETGPRHGVWGGIDGGRAGEGEGRQVVSSYVFQHGMFCVEFRVLVHHASISGGVCGVCAVQGVCAVSGVCGLARAEAQSVP